MPDAGLTIDNKSFLTRRDGYVGTISGDEIPAGLDNIFLRTSARRLDDFEVATYANDTALQVQWGVDAGANNPTLSTAANALRGDASLQIVADAATAAIFREFAHERYGYVYPGGSKPVFDTSTGLGSFLFGPIRGIRFRMTHDGTGSVTIHLIARNTGGSILRRWNVEIDTSGDTMHFIDFTATPDATAGTWDETVVEEIAFGNLQNTVTYRIDDIEFITEADTQDILYEIWRLSGGGAPSSLILNRAGPEGIQVDNTAAWRVEFFDPTGGTTIATSEIIPGTRVIDRIRGGAVTNIVASTASSESAGVVFVSYTPAAADFQAGDLIRITFSGIAIRLVPNVLLTANAAGAQATIQVDDADQFEVGWEVNIFDDGTPDGEIHRVLSIDDANQITLDANLTNSYTTANNARIRRSASFDPVVFHTPITAAGVFDPDEIVRVQEAIFYPVAIHQGTTELVNDGAAPPFVADTVQTTAAAISEGTAEAAWSELLPMEAQGTITIISIYAEFEFQSRFINNAGAGTNSNSKIQMTNDGGSTYVDITDTFTHTGVAFVNRVRAGIGRWFTTITAGTNQLGFRLVQWSDDAGGVDRSEANIRTNSYCRITYVKS